jgi:hypothetical protein
MRKKPLHVAKSSESADRNRHRILISKQPNGREGERGREREREREREENKVDDRKLSLENISAMREAVCYTYCRCCFGILLYIQEPGVETHIFLSHSSFLLSSLRASRGWRGWNVVSLLSRSLGLAS